MIAFLKVPADVLKKIWEDIRIEGIGKRGKSLNYQLPRHKLKKLNPKRAHLMKTWA